MYITGLPVIMYFILDFFNFLLVLKKKKDMWLKGFGCTSDLSQSS